MPTSAALQNTLQRERALSELPKRGGRGWEPRLKAKGTFYLLDRTRWLSWSEGWVEGEEEECYVPAKQISPYVRPV